MHFIPEKSFLKNYLTFEILLLFLAAHVESMSLFGYFSSTLCIWKQNLQLISVTLGKISQCNYRRYLNAI